MKTRVFALCIAILFISSYSFARIRRVGYNGLPLAGVDYTDFNSAHAASTTGDTIQIYGNQSGTSTKQLVIMGFGYNIDNNPNLQAIGTDQPSDLSLTLGLGSANSILEGLSGNFTISTSCITFRRCFGTFTINNNAVAGLSNIRFESCGLQSCNMNNSSINPVNNTQIYNCVYQNINFYLAGTTGSVINCVTASPAYVGSTLNLNNAGFLVKNSIIGTYSTTNINTVYESNFFGTAQPAVLPPGSNNRWGQSWSNIFNRVVTFPTANLDQPSYIYDGNFDEDYFVLKAGSPAINGGFDAANNPTDCGIFGGEPVYLYKLGGVPAVPSIYKLTAPGAAASSNPYNVTISVRSNN
jgi:hypothetical protein